MSTKFSNQSMQKVYDACRALAPDKASEFWTKAGTRRTGSNVRNAYWRGLDGGDANCRKDSLLYAAWAAGRDDRRSK